MEENKTRMIFPIVSLVMLIIGYVTSDKGCAWFTTRYCSLVWYLIAYMLVAFPVIREGWEEMCHGEIFSEYTLMFIATVGAFLIGEYPEAVSVMLFYFVGEMFQDHAVDKANKSIKALVAIRPDRATVISDGVSITRLPDEVAVGEEIEVKPGERVPLDGTLLSSGAAFNTAALTGESVPRQIEQGETVLAGMISADRVTRISVTRKASDSALSRIMDMVSEASERKAPVELFIRKFARIYTPVVIACSLLTFILPYLYSLLSPNFSYVFSDWFYRGLVFLVVSCPCAFVVSIPLSYYAGIGAASRRGILFKGGNFIDAVLAIKYVVFDKTGTLTTGVFSVKEVNGSEDMLQYIAAVERASNHPIAKAILQYADGVKCPVLQAEDVTEISGFGLSATVLGSEVLVGTLRLLRKYDIACPPELGDMAETIVVCARDSKYAGYILLSDTPKSDARAAVSALRQLGMKSIQILSGDKQPLVDKVAASLGVDRGYGDLLPEDKVAHIASLQKSGRVAFVGDGINDAPVIALSDIGIAMGGIGNDVAVETADIVIQNEQPSRVAEAVSIARSTHYVVLQNVIFALAVKISVMLLGVLGVANLWEAVFADVGVTVIAVANALRLVYLKGKK
jgi:Cd2+/Zn2+-exporting ATPase